MEGSSRRFAVKGGSESSKAREAATEEQESSLVASRRDDQNRRNENRPEQPSFNTMNCRHSSLILHKINIINILHNTSQLVVRETRLQNRDSLPLSLSRCVRSERLLSGRLLTTRDPHSITDQETTVAAAVASEASDSPVA